MSLILNFFLGPFCIPQQEKLCKSVLFASGPCGRPGLCVLFGCQIRASFLLSVGIQPIRRYAAYLIASVPYKMCILLFFKSLLKFQLMSKPRRIFYFCKSTVHYELSFRLSKSTLQFFKKQQRFIIMMKPKILFLKKLKLKSLNLFLMLTQSNTHL